VGRVIEVFPRARADVRRNAGRIRRAVSAISADRWNDRIVAAIAALAGDADRHPEADEAADLGLPLRCKAYGRRRHVYRILFTVDGDAVNVLRVRHTAEDRVTADDL
jgi:plasmid stabilization system protein ParE